MKTLAVRLIDGQDLLVEIKALAHKHNIQAGVVLSAVGSLRESRIRMPVIDGNVKYITPSNLEIDTVHGTVSANGVHLHISVSDVEARVYGGHLKEGCIVRTTCELVVGILEDVVFDRVADEATGFEELVVREEAKDGR